MHEHAFPALLCYHSSLVRARHIPLYSSRPQVQNIDIALDKLDTDATCKLGDEDPARFKSRKTMRGPLKRGSKQG